MFNHVTKAIRCLMVVPMLMAGAVTAQAFTLEEVENRIAEAEQLRALEFSPRHYQDAKRSLENAKAYLASGNNAEADRELGNSVDHIGMAMEATQKMNSHFSSLLESRDRMQMADPKHLRADLVERAEKDFSRVIEDVEDGDITKAQKEAKLAKDTIHAAQVVAAREQFTRPIAKQVAAARKVKARQYSPNSLNKALDAQKKIEALIKDDPDAQVQMHAASQQGQYQAERSMKIAERGDRISKNPAEVEKMVDAEEARLRLLGKHLGVDLVNARDAEEQAMMLRQAIEEMEKGYQQQLADSDKTIEALNAKLGTYEGDLASMEDMRRKLQIKRDAEAKIKRLTKLFNADDVEILLTPDSDVILRMKKLNFRSGSAVIPPSTYAMLDNAAQSMIMFSDRAVRVEGHTDAMGANVYNQKLSERRAGAVNAYLSEKLEGRRVIEAVGFGEEKPIANNETAKGREKNRRIDIVLLAPRS